ncbi:hypothetical protein [Streptomyces sp. TLI_146]|uniref:hypothetical protein n=1 Tax=Streptomyces sp. TLI_146 TaxID=1938858 RepID=UPI000C70C667|nr:hypothetical protein [Streptomyces sp. TLI_146]PKV86436.1 hypothetical protein BX283_4000 [Streptomyces sp. TLI_146]
MTTSDREPEPVFIRVGWGGRWRYNPANPLGLTLIFLTLIFVAVAFLVVNDQSDWSEGELRDAAHQAARDLDGSTQRNIDPSLAFSGGDYAQTIEDAMKNTGAAQWFVDPLVLRSHGKDPAAYDITGAGTDAAFCMHLTVSPFGDGQAVIGARVTDGACRGEPEHAEGRHPCEQECRPRRTACWNR